MHYIKHKNEGYDGKYGYKKNACKNGDMAVPTDLLQMLHDKFVEVYGSDHMDNNLVFIKVPGLIKAADGNVYVALLDLDTVSS